MDIQFMKSAAQDQMEMMLMQMENLQDFDDDSDDGNNLLQHFNVQSPATATAFDVHPPNMPLSTAADQDPPFLSHSGSGGGGWDSDSDDKRSSMAAMREMIFRIAAMQPVHIDPESVKRPQRKNVKISTDPQSVAARHRRERISERIRILQRLVPGGTKMDTASMLDEAIHYVKFLKTQVQSLEQVAANRPPPPEVGFPVAMSSRGYFPTPHGRQY